MTGLLLQACNDRVGACQSGIACGNRPCIDSDLESEGVDHVNICVVYTTALATWRINLYVGEMPNYGQLVGGKLGGQYKTQLHKLNNVTYIINHNSDPSIQYNANAPSNTVRT